MNDYIQSISSPFKKGKLRRSLSCYKKHSAPPFLIVKPQRLKRYLTTALLSAGFLASNSAFALGFCDIFGCSSSGKEIMEEDIYSGTSCIPGYSASVEDFEWSIAGIRNRASTAKNIICPVTRHYTQFNTSARLFAVEVYNPGTQYLECKLTSLDGEGKTLDSLIVSTFGSGKQYLPVSRPLHANRRSGELSMSCYLPAGAKVLNYKVHEHMATTN